MSDEDMINIPGAHDEHIDDEVVEPNDFVNNEVLNGHIDGNIMAANINLMIGGIPIDNYGAFMDAFQQGLAEIGGFANIENIGNLQYDEDQDEVDEDEDEGNEGNEAEHNIMIPLIGQAMMGGNMEYNDGDPPQYYDEYWTYDMDSQTIPRIGDRSLTIIQNIMMNTVQLTKWVSGMRMDNIDIDDMTRAEIQRSRMDMYLQGLFTLFTTIDDERKQNAQVIQYIDSCTQTIMAIIDIINEYDTIEFEPLEHFMWICICIAAKLVPEILQDLVKSDHFNSKLYQQSLDNGLCPLAFAMCSADPVNVTAQLLELGIATKESIYDNTHSFAPLEVLAIVNPNGLQKLFKEVITDEDKGKYDWLFATCCATNHMSAHYLLTDEIVTPEMFNYEVKMNNGAIWNTPLGIVSSKKSKLLDCILESKLMSKDAMDKRNMYEVCALNAACVVNSVNALKLLGSKFVTPSSLLLPFNVANNYAGALTKTNNVITVLMKGTSDVFSSLINHELMTADQFENMMSVTESVVIKNILMAVVRYMPNLADSLLDSKIWTKEQMAIKQDNIGIVSFIVRYPLSIDVVTKILNHPTMTYDTFYSDFETINHPFGPTCKPEFFTVLLKSQHCSEETLSKKVSSSGETVIDIICSNSNFANVVNDIPYITDDTLKGTDANGLSYYSNIIANISMDEFNKFIVSKFNHTEQLKNNPIGNTQFVKLILNEKINTYKVQSLLNNDDIMVSDIINYKDDQGKHPLHLFVTQKIHTNMIKIIMRSKFITLDILTSKEYYIDGMNIYAFMLANIPSFMLTTFNPDSYEKEVIDIENLKAVLQYNVNNFSPYDINAIASLFSPSIPSNFVIDQLKRLDKDYYRDFYKINKTCSSIAHCAVFNNDIFEMMIKEGIILKTDLVSKDSNGNIPLMLAIDNACVFANMLKYDMVTDEQLSCVNEQGANVFLLLMENSIAPKSPLGDPNSLLVMLLEKNIPEHVFNHSYKNSEDEVINAYMLICYIGNMAVLDRFVRNQYFKFDSFKAAVPRLNLTKKGIYSGSILDIIISKHDTKLEGLQYPVYMNKQPDEPGKVFQPIISTILEYSIMNNVELEYSISDIEPLFDDIGNGFIRKIFKEDCIDFVKRLCDYYKNDKDMLMALIFNDDELVNLMTQKMYEFIKSLPIFSYDFVKKISNKYIDVNIDVIKYIFDDVFESYKNGTINESTLDDIITVEHDGIRCLKYIVINYLANNIVLIENKTLPAKYLTMDVSINNEYISNEHYNEALLDKIIGPDKDIETMKMVINNYGLSPFKKLWHMGLRPSIIGCLTIGLINHVILHEEFSEDMLFDLDNFKHNILMIINDDDIIRIIIDNKWTDRLINEGDIDKDSLPMFVSEHTLEYLIEHGYMKEEHVMKENAIGISPLHHMIIYNKINNINIMYQHHLLDNPKVFNTRDMLTGDTPLICIAKSYKKHPELFDMVSTIFTPEMLMEPNIVTGKIMIDYIPNQKKKCEMLLNPNMNSDVFNYIDNDGNNILMRNMGDYEFLAAVIDHEFFDPNMLHNRNKITHMTPILMAAKTCSECFKILLRHPETTPNDLYHGHTDFGSALHIGARYEPLIVKYVFDWDKINDTLVYIKQNGQTFMHVACRYQPQAVKYALDSTYNITNLLLIPDLDMNISIEIACIWSPESVKNLLKSEYGKLLMNVEHPSKPHFIHNAMKSHPLSLKYILESEHCTDAIINKQDEAGYKIFSKLIHLGITAQNVKEKFLEHKLSNVQNIDAPDDSPLICQYCCKHYSNVMLKCGNCDPLACASCALLLKKCPTCRSNFKDFKLLY